MKQTAKKKITNAKRQKTKAAVTDKITNVLVYSSNNSGGSWWLKDHHWKALERAGWNVHWVQPSKRFGDGERPASSYKNPMEPCPRHPPKVQWLGAHATSAARNCMDPNEGIDEFEQVTGMDTGDRGCNCCGPPHSFTWYDANGNTQYASSEIVETRCRF